jgi:hypothetical protein
MTLTLISISQFVFQKKSSSFMQTIWPMELLSLLLNSTSSYEQLMEHLDFFCFLLNLNLI